MLLKAMARFSPVREIVTFIGACRVPRRLGRRMHCTARDDAVLAEDSHVAEGLIMNSEWLLTDGCWLSGAMTASIHVVNDVRGGSLGTR